jgi:uncharacterized protein YdiU (UPF0061 family)
MKLPFDNTYARLPDRFFARVDPTPVRKPELVKINASLAELLGLDAKALASDDGVAVLSGNARAEGSEPIALAYAGHQFGTFVPRLGDGRAILLGEIVGTDGVRRDVQLKGSGPTPFSRRGDGRAALGPVLREYVVSEAMAALGVPTTRSLAAVRTGEPVHREGALPGGVLTRVASSHIRVGTFEYFSARDDIDAIATLAKYALERHYPDAASSPNVALALLEKVVGAQASLVAKWLGVGFVHGVMNTDNTSVAGETIDYGPCAFLDEYHPRKTFSSIDMNGRYAFMNQPRIAQWNLLRLGETLLPLVSKDEDEAARLATECIEGFGPRFQSAYASAMRAKLGLRTEDAGDLDLVMDLLLQLSTDEVDYTIFFRTLSTEPASLAHGEWVERWRVRLAAEGETPESRAEAMRRVNPKYIPRNHRIEEAIAAAYARADLAPFETLVRVLAHPFDEQPDAAHLAEPPKPDERVTQTFCGT